MPELNGEIEPQGKLRVLVVEDDKPTLGILKNAVKFQGGFDAVYAESTLKALEILRQAKEEGNPFGLVFSDLGLGNDTEGGFKIAGIAKTEKLTDVFILFTGRAGEVEEQYREKLREMGIDKLIKKPASAETLENSLDWAKETIKNMVI